ncbi:MAG: hypothetical protein J6A69_04380 [Clostridia bacterium]|nr:hypothetical protein [Clostridia bacterium]
MKKLISLILAVILVMSSVSVLASDFYDGYGFMEDVFMFDVGDFVVGEGLEEDTDEGIDEDVELMKFLESIGLWDNSSISKDELLTMQSFSKILSKVKLGTENAFSKIYDRNPINEYATYNHAYTYLVEALGYSYKCRQYPNATDANIIVAAEIGLLNQRPENIHSYITRGELAKLIYKAVNMDLCVVEYPSDGGYTHTVVNGKTLLNSVHNIHRIEGFVNAIEGLNVYENEKIRTGYFQINRRDIKTGGIDVTKYFASRVYAYTRYDEYLGEHTLIAIKMDEDTKAFEVDFRNLTYVNDLEIGYLDENGNEEIFNVSNLRYVIENGEKLSSISQICDYDKNEGVIKFLSSTDSGTIDTAVIYKYNYFVVNNVDTRLFRIALRYNRKHNNLPYIQLDDHATMNVYIDGVKSDYSKLVSGSIIKFFECPSTGYVWINAKSKNAITDEVEIIDGNVVTFGGKEYRIARDWEFFVDQNKNNTSISSFQRPKELELGVNITFYEIDGIIAAYISNQSYQYGYIKSASQSRTSLDPSLTLRVFTQEGEWKDYKVSDKLEFEGQTGVSKDVLIEAFNDEVRISDFFDHPVRFRANGDKIDAIDTIFESQFETDTDDDMVFTQYLAMARGQNFEDVGRDQPFLLSENTVVFVCPDGSDDESEFKVITNRQIPAAQNGIYVPTKIYNLNQAKQISVMVMTRGLEASGGSTAFYYIDKITKAVLDADDQIFGYKVSAKEFWSVERGVGSLRDTYFYVDEKTLNKNDVNPGEDNYTLDNIMEVGDVISGIVFGNEIATWNMVLKGGVVPTPTPADDGVSDKKNIAHNEYFAAGKFIYADTESGVWVTEVDGTQMPSVPAVGAIINPNTKKIVPATASDFLEGIDNVYYHWKEGRGKFFIKNEY